MAEWRFNLNLRVICTVVALAFGASSAVRAQDVNPANSVVWKKVHASMFGNAPMEAADAVVKLDTPKRAEDAAIVPLAIRAGFPQTKDRYIEKILSLIHI